MILEIKALLLLPGVKSFLISLIANIATNAGQRGLKKIFQSDIQEREVKIAYENALKKWCRNKSIREKEQFWNKRRFELLVNCISNPELEKKLDNGTKKLIKLFLKELMIQPNAWPLIQSEYFKESIVKLNNIESHLQTLIQISGKFELDTETIIKNLRNQSEKQVTKQINSGKYIRNTFIETTDLKDYIRYFSDPFTFFNKIIHEIEILDFNYLNRKRKISGHESFVFDVSEFKSENGHREFTVFNEKISRLETYLTEKQKELEEAKTNRSHSFSYKIKHKVDDLKYFTNRVLILTANAGQGKTNLICDFVDKSTLKRNIPTIFLTGFEIKATDIRETIARSILPNADNTANQIIETIGNYCEEHEVPFIIIIDGLNENYNSREFSQNIENLVSTSLEYDFLRFIFTCRTEYFENSFKNLLCSDFKEQIILVDEINKKLNSRQKKRLYEGYCSHFNVKINQISPSVYEQLIDNFLMLRIFMEVNANTTIDQIYNIYKPDLFCAYYKIKVQEINIRLKENDEFNIIGNFDVNDFLKKIIKYMIDKKRYSNIPMNEIIALGINNEILVRFLDENILIRRDIESGTTITGNNEVLNFTFDEFRDYLIFDYLINVVHKDSVDDFNAIVNSILNPESQIFEGFSTFLFWLIRKDGDTELKKYIESQEWYNVVFLRGIFSIPDAELNLDDINKIKELYFANPDFCEHITFEIIYHKYDTSYFKNLNINTLIDILIDLDDSELEKSLYNIYDDSGYRRKTEVESFCEALEKVLEKHDFNEFPKYHSLFRYLLFLTPLSWKVEDVFYNYWLRYKESSFLLLLSEKCKSNRVKQSVSNLIQENEI